MVARRCSCDDSSKSGTRSAATGRLMYHRARRPSAFQKQGIQHMPRNPEHWFWQRGLQLIALGRMNDAACQRYAAGIAKGRW